MEVSNVPWTIYTAVISAISTRESNPFQALGQWEHSKKRAGVKRGLGEERMAPRLLSQTPLVANPAFLIVPTDRENGTCYREPCECKKNTTLQNAFFYISLLKRKNNWKTAKRKITRAQPRVL